jgi:hypothetical protein
MSHELKPGAVLLKVSELGLQTMPVFPRGKSFPYLSFSIAHEQRLQLVNSLPEQVSLVN